MGLNVSLVLNSINSATMIDRLATCFFRSSKMSGSLSVLLHPLFGMFLTGWSGKGKESDPTDALVDTLPMRRPTYHRRVGRQSTNTLHINKKNLPSLTVLLLLSVGSKSNLIRKDGNVKAKQPPF